MEERIIKKFSNGNFYLFGLLIAIVLLYGLTLVFAFVGVAIVDYHTPGNWALVFAQEVAANNVENMSEATLAINVISQTMSELLLGGVFIVFLIKEFKKDLFSFKKELKYYFLLIGVGFLSILVLGVLLDQIYKIFNIGGQPENQELIDMFLQSDSKVFMMITSVLLAPFVEEIIFRKFLYGVVEEKLHLKPIFSIAISAVAFAAIHAVDVFFFQYLSMAIVLCTAYALSKKNIWVPIGIHFLNNSLVLLIFLFPGAV